MKAVKSTGLIPVKFARNGEIAGVAPGKVAALLAAGAATLVDIPAGTPTIEVNVTLPAPRAGQKPAEELKPPGEVEIPEGWRDSHHLQMVALAKKILGVEKLEPPADVKPADYALEVVTNEVARRAEANPKT